MTNQIELSGIGERLRSEARLRTAAIVAGEVLLAASLLTACAAEEQPGIVMTGADGEMYVLPEDAQRPVYRSKEDCEADVREQIDKLRQDGVEVTENPADLCEDTETYRRGGHAVVVPFRSYYGPILPGGSRWESPRVSSWVPVSDGMFAVPGNKLQGGIEKAAPGMKAGTKTTIKGGFGSSGKGGFGHGVSS